MPTPDTSCHGAIGRYATARDARRRRAGVAMWSAIALAGVLLVVLLSLVWGSNAWGTAAGVLVLACVAVCASSAVVAERAAREVEREAERLLLSRRQPAGAPRRPDRASDRDPGRPMPDQEVRS